MGSVLENARPVQMADVSPARSLFTLQNWRKTIRHRIATVA
jgi:hypothetical protein